MDTQVKVQVSCLNRARNNKKNIPKFALTNKVILKLQILQGIRARQNSSGDAAESVAVETKVLKMKRGLWKKAKT